MSICLIIGAGMTGLVAAFELRRHGWDALVLDKGRGVGGRMATRRIEDAVFDHGAQFFTARSPEFQGLVTEWCQADVAVEWCRGFSVNGEAIASDNHPRYRGRAGMTDVTKFLAIEANVHLSQRVLTIESQASGWRARTASGDVFAADSLMLTAPVPQSLALLDAGNYVLPQDIRVELESVVYDPCIALLALLEGGSALPAPGAIQFESGPVSWMADNHQKGISPRPGAVTIHAGSAFSRAHWEVDDATVANVLVSSVQHWLGSPVASYQVQRWRYSKVVKNHPWPYVAMKSPAPLIFAGDVFAGAKVEGSALSGLAASGWLMFLR